MANFQYQKIDYLGTDQTFTAPTGGVLADSIQGADLRGFLWVKNAAAGGTITVTVHVPGSSFGISLPDVAVTVPDGEERLIGPITNELTDPAFLGTVAMSITGTMTGVTAAALTLP